MRRFDGKVVVVTGGTAGIGLAVAERFQKEGAKVVVCSRKLNSVESRSKNFTGISCNISAPSDREKLLELVKTEFGQLDVLVLNAATSLSFGLSGDCEESKWDKMMETNVKANWMLAKMFLPIITPNTGSIVFISSYAGYNPDTPIGVYGLTKTTLIGLTKLLANEYGRIHKIRVNGVAPGVIQTKFSKALWESEEIRTLNEKSTSLGRIGRPDEVAGPVLFLASDDASYITGEIILVAGGMPCRL
jgi:dehydrogenase/reductase SDR family protein 4